MQRFFILFSALLPFLISAQSRIKTPDFAVKGFVGIPQTISSNMFRTAFSGVYSLGASVDFRAFDNFFVGLGIKNTRFKNNEGLFASQSYPELDPVSGKPTGKILLYNTRLDLSSGFVRFGYNKYFERGYLSYALNVGVSMANYTRVIDSKAPENMPSVATSFQCGFLQPEISYNFLTDGRLNFSILTSYNILIKKFDPKAPRFNGIAEIRTAKNNMPISWLNLGFGFTVILGKLK